LVEVSVNHHDSLKAYHEAEKARAEKATVETVVAVGMLGAMGALLGLALLFLGDQANSK
jgi:hypothetical protein